MDDFKYKHTMRIWHKNVSERELQTGSVLHVAKLSDCRVTHAHIQDTFFKTCWTRKGNLLSYLNITGVSLMVPVNLWVSRVMRKISDWKWAARLPHLQLCDHYTLLWATDKNICRGAHTVLMIDKLDFCKKKKKKKKREKLQCSICMYVGQQNKTEKQKIYDA